MNKIIISVSSFAFLVIVLHSLNTKHSSSQKADAISEQVVGLAEHLHSVESDNIVIINPSSSEENSSLISDDTNSTSHPGVDLLSITNSSQIVPDDDNSQVSAAKKVQSVDAERRLPKPEGDTPERAERNAKIAAPIDAAADGNWDAFLSLALELQSMSDRIFNNTLRAAIKFDAPLHVFRELLSRGLAFSLII